MLTESVVCHQRRALVVSSPKGKGSPIQDLLFSGGTVNLSSQVDHQEMGGEHLLGARMLWSESWGQEIMIIVKYICLVLNLSPSSL